MTDSENHIIKKNNMTDCGLKCFELQDTEYSLAVEKENNQKLEAEVKRLKGIIETPCTSCCITESLEQSLDELNDQIVNQEHEIRQLKEQIEKMKCCENSTTTLSGEFISCSLQEEKAALQEAVEKLKAEIEELKKQKIDWHTITCFDEPDEDGFITHDNPSDVGYDFLIRLKGGTVTVDTLTECDQGVIFENYEWRDIESWAYIPERIRVVNSEKSRRN